MGFYIGVFYFLLMLEKYIIPTIELF